MTATEPSAPSAVPDVAIRARPPSPKRLSRKVLLTGAVIFASIIVAALFVGLGERPSRRAGAAQESAASGGPPETIRLAPSHYELTAPAPVEGDAPSESELVLPDAPARPGAGDARAEAAPREDPAETARLSPILFGERRDRALAGSENGRLEARLSPPRSRYEILAGSVIPAALSTELNSDLPGRVIAQVTAPVFDTVTGAHLLIPQGARLIGAYDSAVGHGQARLQIVWHRLILPDGWSIDLSNMEGADPAGAAGLRDSVDNHLVRLAGAVVLSSIMGVTANEAEDDDDDRGFSRSVGDAAAQEAARSGGRIVERELQITPTLRVRPGAPVRVLVMRDIMLRPYDARRR